MWAAIVINASIDPNPMLIRFLGSNDLFKGSMKRKNANPDTVTLINEMTELNM